jgi:hypothetical protein
VLGLRLTESASVMYPAAVLFFLALSPDIPRRLSRTLPVTQLDLEPTQVRRDVIDRRLVHLCWVPEIHGFLQREDAVLKMIIEREL